MNKRKFLKINTPKELALQLKLSANFIIDVADNINRHYRVFTETDKKGKERKFFNGSDDLKLIHKKINKLLDRIEYPNSIQGGIIGKSIFTNALMHAGKKYVANFDIKNFFPSINHRVVYNAFLNQKCTPNVAGILTKLTTAEDCLPQGFATSPKISGLVLFDIDKRLTNLLSRYSLKHSFWIDDLTISGNYPVNKFEKLIYKIFKQSSFELNRVKTHITDYHQKQTCTGLTINCRPNADKNIRDELRKELYLCRKFGMNSFLNKNKPNIDKEKYLMSLRGKISFLISLSPKYLAYKEQFNQINYV